MTTLALYPDMLAVQRKARQAIMIEARLLPVAAVVALAAGSSVYALMTVIFAMTADTVAWRTRNAVGGTVTGGAACGAVLTEQREARMIEAALLPADRRMAVLATRAACPLVTIVAQMTGNAGAWCLLPALANMAGHTGHALVPTDERIACHGMVERLDCLPRSLDVTTFAFLSQLAAMRIPGRMASSAGFRRRPEFRARAVACSTFERRMRSLQWIIRQAGMIEARTIETDQSRRAAMVLAVTGLASHRAGLAIAAVKALAGRDVRTYLPVTSDTFGRLGFTSEVCMARFTLRLKIGMRHGQRTRRNQTLEQCLRGHWPRKEQNREKKKGSNRRSHQY